MSKAIPATCTAGLVTAQGVPVPAAEILSQGVGSSSGVLVLDEDEAFYIAKVTPDLDAALEQVIAALTQAVTALNNVATTFTATFATMTGPTTAAPPTGPTGVANISTAATAITAAKTQLQTLKGMLR